MPRDRSVVMDKHDLGDLHQAAIKKTIKLYSPYAVVDGDELGLDENLYYVVYRAPKVGKRKIMANRSKRANAIKLRDMLNDAWAEGMYSSLRV